MRVTQKIVVGSISINSVQNSSIVQIGSSGMIQSQTESMGNGANAAGGSTATTGSMKAPVSPQAPCAPGGVMQAMPPTHIPPVAPFAKPNYPAPGGVAIPPFVYGPTGPLGPVGGIGITRDEPIEKHTQSE